MTSESASSDEEPKMRPQRRILRYGLACAVAFTFGIEIRSILINDPYSDVSFFAIATMAFLVLGFFVGMAESYWRVRRRLDELRARVVALEGIVVFRRTGGGPAS